MIMCSERGQDGLATTELSLQEVRGAGRGLFIRQIVVRDPSFFFFRVSSEITEIRRVGVQTVVLLRLTSIRVSVSGGGSPVALGWLQCDCESWDEVSTDKVRGLMDGQSGELDVRMDEGRGGI